MTLTDVCASDVCFSLSRFTGKERDTESGNDYFGEALLSKALRLIS
jgi:hypothetical protein